MSAAYARVLQRLVEVTGYTPRGRDSAKMARCPAHDDREASLSVGVGRDGVVLKCQANCATEAVLAALKLDWSDLFDKPKESKRNEPLAVYDYVDEQGRLLFQVCRFPGKQFRQRRREAAGWSWKLGDTRRVLYRLPHALEAAKNGETVYVVEGEKDVASAERAGAVATCNPMGAGKWRDEYATYLKGAGEAIIVADRDEPGREHAQLVADSLGKIGVPVRIVEAIAGKDLTDHLDAGHGLDELRLIPPGRNRATAQPRTSTAMPPLAQLHKILDRIADEVRTRGLVGEERLAQTLYLILTSRLLDKQVSAGVKGHSSSGKSYTVETVTRFFPPEAYLEFTAMSERALVYSDEEFAHRTLIVYEVVALREGIEDDMTSYFIRSLLSEGRIDYEVTIRGKDGGFTTKKIVKEGPTNLIFTTTKTKVHAENETRIMSLATDDSREQTARVLLEVAGEGHNRDDLEPWRDLQRWLAEQDNRVTIPYARALAERIPPVAVRLRRDFGALLALVRAHALLHQVNRVRDDTGRIIAELDDYAVVRGLVAEIISEGVGTTVSETVRETVQAVATLETSDGVMARAVADKLSLDKSNASRRLRVAADGGYVRNLEDKRGKPGRWVIGDPLPETVDLLPDPAQLATDSNPPDQGGCAVAADPEEKSEGTARANGSSPDPENRCAVCAEPIPSGHRFCSRECAQKDREAAWADWGQ